MPQPFARGLRRLARTGPRSLWRRRAAEAEGEGRLGSPTLLECVDRLPADLDQVSQVGLTQPLAARRSSAGSPLPDPEREVSRSRSPFRHRRPATRRRSRRHRCRPGTRAPSRRIIAAPNPRAMHSSITIRPYLSALNRPVEGDGNADHRQHGEQDPQPRPRGVRVDGDLDDCQQDAEEDDGGYELAEVAVAGACPRRSASPREADSGLVVSLDFAIPRQ